MYSKKHIMLFSWFLNEPSGYLLEETPVFMRFIFFADIVYIAHWGKNLWHRGPRQHLSNQIILENGYIWSAWGIVCKLVQYQMYQCDRQVFWASTSNKTLLPCKDFRPVNVVMLTGYKVILFPKKRICFTVCTLSGIPCLWLWQLFIQVFLSSKRPLHNCIYVHYQKNSSHRVCIGDRVMSENNLGVSHKSYNFMLVYDIIQNHNDKTKMPGWDVWGPELTADKITRKKFLHYLQ